MKTWQKGALVAAGVGLAGILVSRFLWFRRRALSSDWRIQQLPLPDETSIVAAHLGQGRECLVVLAHGLGKPMRDHGVSQLAERLGEHFDVLAFDFPGHGMIGGTCALDLAAAAAQVRKLVDYGRGLGYQYIALVGCSMGGAAAIISAAQGAPVDAVVTISSPAGPPRHTRVVVPAPVRWWARLMGTRLAQQTRPTVWPAEFVDQVSPIPLLIVHNGLDTLVSREDSETLFALAHPPKDMLLAPHALHAASKLSAQSIISWLDERMPQEAASELS